MIFQFLQLNFPGGFFSPAACRMFCWVINRIWHIQGFSSSQILGEHLKSPLWIRKIIFHSSICRFKMLVFKRLWEVCVGFWGNKIIEVAWGLTRVISEFFLGPLLQPGNPTNLTTPTKMMWKTPFRSAYHQNLLHHSKKSIETRRVSKKSPTGPTERTPKPEYLIARSQPT